MDRRVSGWAAAVLCAAVLVACGGGGGDDRGAPPPPPPPPAPAEVTVSGPTPVAADCRGGSTGGSFFADAEVEPWLAIDPRNGRIRVAAWQQDRWTNGGARAVVSATSQDGGATWRPFLHPFSRCGGAAAGSPGDFERATDPWVEVGADGTVHMMALATTGLTLRDGSSSTMLVSRSTDGGLTWSAPQALIRDDGLHHNDKNTLTPDPLDPRRVYAVWNRLDRGGRGPAMFARSTDSGATWEPAREIVDPVPPGGVGSARTLGNRVLVVQAGAQRGALVNVFTLSHFFPGGVTRRVAAVTSTDGGDTWSAPVIVGDLREVGTRDPATGRTVRDGSILPAVTAGPDGTLWVAWQDGRFNDGAFDAIVLSRSTDAGRTWSAPAVVNRVRSTAAFTPVLHVRPDGRLGVLHFDLRNDTPDPDTLLADVWLRTTTDGTTWDETHVAGPVNLLNAPDAAGLFLGDYHGLASDGEDFVALVALPDAQTAGRTDVVAVRRRPPAR